MRGMKKKITTSRKKRDNKPHQVKREKNNVTRSAATPTKRLIRRE
jgi:hypothetical protein